jgi:drug/metabolite transporter superfamily protein YnfA
VSDWVRENVRWFDAFRWVYVLVTAGYALYAWLKLRDTPLAICFGGVALTIFGGLSDRLLLEGVGVLLFCYGIFLGHRRRWQRPSQ